MEVEKISATGNNLVVCLCPEENSRPSDWMTFSTWYSTKKLLPDAAFICFVPKKTNPKEITFGWLDRCQIKKFNTSNPQKNKEMKDLPKKRLLFLKPEAIMVRTFYEEELNEINSESDLTGNDSCEFANSSKYVKFAAWLADSKMSQNPVYLCTHGRVSGIDVKTWAAQSREPIFLANWNPATMEEKVIQDAWRKMYAYYMMVV